MAFDTESTLAITIRSDGDGILIAPRGDLDEETVPTFEFCLDDALETGRTPIRIDLGQILFVDITGYRAMTRFGDRCERRNLVTEFVNPSSSVELMFRILGSPRGARFDEASDSDVAPVS